MEYQRNYKEEWKKEKETKTSRLLKIEKNLNSQLTEKLKQDNISYSQFVHICIDMYLKGNLKLD